MWERLDREVQFGWIFLRNEKSVLKYQLHHFHKTYSKSWHGSAFSSPNGYYYFWRSCSIQFLEKKKIRKSQTKEKKKQRKKKNKIKKVELQAILTADKKNNNKHGVKLITKEQQSFQLIFHR